MALKKKHSWVMASLTMLGKMYHMATDNNCCFNCTRLLIFAEYPCGTLTKRRHWQKLIFSFLDKVWHVGGKYIFLPSDIGCNDARIPILARSWRVIKASFVLPWMLRSVPMTPSHTFFSTYLTSIQCRTSRSD